VNRKQRRAKGIKEKEPVINIKASDIEQIKKDALSKAIDTSFMLMLGIPLIALRDEYGFGKVRLERLMDRMLEVYDSFNKDYLTLEDLHKTIFEETGVQITKG
jgi:hypothetical protein